MRTRTASQERMRTLPVGGSFIHPRCDLRFAVYVSHFGKRTGKRFRTRCCALGRRVERLA